MRKSLGWIMATSLTLLAATDAQASFIVQAGIVGGSGDVDNVISNGCTGTVTGPASTVQGCLSSAQTTFIDFSSTTDLLSITGGQATLSADDGIINQLSISLTGPNTFSKLIIDLQHTNNTPASVSFSAAPNSGLGPYNFALGNGSNFFTITGENFDTVSFASTVGIEVLTLEVKQVRLGGIGGPGDQCGGAGQAPCPTPEPTSLLLLGTGLLSAAYVRKRIK